MLPSTMYLPRLSREQQVDAAVWAVITVLLYWPTLFLPWSLVDDGRMIPEAISGLRILQSGDVMGGMSAVLVTDANYAGPAMRAQIAIQWLLFGDHPFLWHVVRIAQCLLVVLGVMTLARQCGAGRLGGHAAAAAFFVATPPSEFPDIQGYFLNYARLLTTDGYVAPAAVWAAVALAAIFTRGPSKRVVAAWVVLMFVVSTTKLTMLAYQMAFLLAAAFAWWHTRRTETPIPAWLMALPLAAAIPGLIVFEPWRGSVQGYEGLELATSPAAFLGVLGSHLGLLIQGIGVFLFAGFAVVCVRFARTLRSPQSSSAGPLFLLLMLFLGTLSFQSLWPIVLPRYMLVYSPFAAALAGIGLESLGRRLLSGVNWRWWWLPALAPVGMLAWFLAFYPYYFPWRVTMWRQIWPAIGVLLLMLPFIALVKGSSEACSRPWRLTKSLALASLLGIVGWKLVIAAAAIHEQRVRYCSAEVVYGRVVTQSMDSVALLLPEVEGRLVTNLEGELLGSARRIPPIMKGAAAVPIEPLAEQPPDWRPVQDTDTVLFYFSDLHPASTAPPFEGAQRLHELLAMDAPAGIGRLEVGEYREFGFTMPQAMSLHRLSIDIDPLSWHHEIDLSLEASVNAGDLLEVGRLPGRLVTRGRLGTQLLYFHQPLPLLAGDQVRLRLKPVKAETNGQPRSVRGYAPLVFEAFSAINGQPLSSPVPRLQLHASLADETAFQFPVLHATSTSLVINAPEYLALRYLLGHAWPPAWCADSWRIVERKHRADVFMIRYQSE